VLHTSRGDIVTRWVVNAAGLPSDLPWHSAARRPHTQIV
jgi:hypothetical protein